MMRQSDNQNRKNRPKNRKYSNHNHNNNRAFESSGPNVKIKGSVGTIAEKYNNLARDANSSGDHVAAENYLQHAEHYIRIQINAKNREKPAPNSNQQQNSHAKRENDNRISQQSRKEQFEQRQKHKNANQTRQASPENKSNSQIHDKPTHRSEEKTEIDISAVNFLANSTNVTENKEIESKKIENKEIESKEIESKEKNVGSPKEAAKPSDNITDKKSDVVEEKSDKIEPPQQALI